MPKQEVCDLWRPLPLSSAHPLPSLPGRPAQVVDLVMARLRGGLATLAPVLVSADAAVGGAAEVLQEADAVRDASLLHGESLVPLAFSNPAVLRDQK